MSIFIAESLLGTFNRLQHSIVNSYVRSPFNRYFPRVININNPIVRQFCYWLHASAVTHKLIFSAIPKYLVRRAVTHKPCIMINMSLLFHDNTVTPYTCLWFIKCSLKLTNVFVRQC